MARRAKLFTNGGSQAVRLPAEFRFDGDYVFIRRDPLTGNVILSQSPTVTWEEFKALLDESPGTDVGDFIPDRPTGTTWRDPFEGWTE